MAFEGSLGQGPCSTLGFALITHQTTSNCSSESSGSIRPSGIHNACPSTTLRPVRFAFSQFCKNPATPALLSEREEAKRKGMK